MNWFKLVSRLAIGAFIFWIIYSEYTFLFVDVDIELKVSGKFWERSEECFVQGLKVSVTTQGYNDQNPNPFWPSEVSSANSNCLDETRAGTYYLEVGSVGNQNRIGIDCSVSLEFWKTYNVGDKLISHGPRSGPIRCSTLH